MMLKKSRRQRASLKDAEGKVDRVCAENAWHDHSHGEMVIITAYKLNEVFREAIVLKCKDDERVSHTAKRIFRSSHEMHIER